MLAEFLKFKTRKNGQTSYRQNGSTVSIVFPASAFDGEPPSVVQIEADNLAAPVARTGGTRQVDPAIAQARQVLADARAARKQALADKLAAMTPEQRAKRDERLAKLKAKVAAKKANG